MRPPTKNEPDSWRRSDAPGRRPAQLDPRPENSKLSSIRSRFRAQSRSETARAVFPTALIPPVRAVPHRQAADSCRVETASPVRAEAPNPGPPRNPRRGPGAGPVANDTGVAARRMQHRGRPPSPARPKRANRVGPRPNDTLPSVLELRSPVIPARLSRPERHDGSRVAARPIPQAARCRHPPALTMCLASEPVRTPVPESASSVPPGPGAPRPAARRRGFPNATAPSARPPRRTTWQGRPGPEGRGRPPRPPSVTQRFPPPPLGHRRTTARPSRPAP